MSRGDSGTGTRGGVHFGCKGVREAVDERVDDDGLLGDDVLVRENVGHMERDAVRLLLLCGACGPAS